mmetsp:Transcript_9841/g.19484  ORF Transcript_9841/g.19484 Transcript_9841/m.19484 type:complete len:232 (+) Transcript_9841:1604-2299(+)|eukprot:CAMPEP_0204919902 /NCGR_PEP_ID=MMETSP1397-20131031/17077_1 /ASSEMBLY_ACC=CAM_ASM_000891 /TAXON_ID=49980 /ORGANISM="Climacostomum Climacostomum virens, Strain Stock W-24" /LENGTH=231 /DNA_ID=CAMNT_0052093533 /DNA_START=803 /DNA_END=1498 /DNA_ORIENTATION=+
MDNLDSPRRKHIGKLQSTIVETQQPTNPQSKLIADSLRAEETLTFNQYPEGKQDSNFQEVQAGLDRLQQDLRTQANTNANLARKFDIVRNSMNQQVKNTNEYVARLESELNGVASWLTFRASISYTITRVKKIVYRKTGWSYIEFRARILSGSLWRHLALSAAIRDQLGVHFTLGELAYLEDLLVAFNIAAHKGQSNTTTIKDLLADLPEELKPHAEILKKIYKVWEHRDS